MKEKCEDDNYILYRVSSLIPYRSWTTPHWWYRGWCLQRTLQSQCSGLLFNK